MSAPDFKETARAWLLRAQGHVQPWDLISLADELSRAWELGIAQSIGVVAGVDSETLNLDTDVDIAIENAVGALRKLTDKAWP